MLGDTPEYQNQGKAFPFQKKLKENYLMNSINTEKTIGYILLIIGLMLIILPLWQTYGIFTGKVVPMEVFKSQKINPPNQNNNPLDLQQQLQTALLKVLPIDLFNNTLNLGSWLILMWILIFGGGQIAGIGIKLIK